jgi:hypothetical protein
MRPAKIELEIEELVLYGFRPADRYRIGEFVERELQRLFGEQRGSIRDFEAAHLEGGSFEMAHGSKPEAIGAQIARAVYQACTVQGLPAKDGAGRAGTTSPAPARLP